MRSSRRLPLFAVTLLAAACVDPSSLRGFECDSQGSCVLPDGGRAGGGGGGTGGGGGVGGGGGGAVTGGGGGTSCDSTSCTGCCDDTGACRGGNQQDVCGQAGVACAACASGTHCSAGICQPLTANGGTCGTDTDCASGKCVSAICCDSACVGSCETCTAAGSEGTCSPLAEATTVGACGAYACDGISGACPTTCTASRQCATGHYCAGGSCAPLKAQGTACASNSECSSNFCADGVCCDGACSGSCDRCNLGGTTGTCSPAPASDPGSPACGGTVVCNGSLVDCPITCASGCPSNTYCGGMYCAAKKPPGVSCGAPGECLSNFCADGVCCDSACGGACDACSVAQGASQDGTCTLLGPSRVCRGASSNCDREERCSGTSDACPANAFVDAGVACGTTSFSGWSLCDAGAGCASNGVQTRTRTELACTGLNGTCSPSADTESQPCARPTDGVSCGSATYGSYTACSYASACSTSGTRTRPRTDPICANGTCSAVQTTETDTAGCARTTENQSCGTPTYGSWSTCSFAATCDESGTRTRTRTDPVCQAMTCGTTTATETDTTSCGRSTGGMSCGATSYGSWSACTYASPCAASGSRTRTVTTYACGSGACNSTMTTETDSSSACDRTTQGTSCAPTDYGQYTTCTYADTCSNSGTRSRQVTTYTCAAGTCASNTTSEDGSAGCARNTNGVECRPAVGLCDQAEVCSSGACPSDGYLPGGTVCREADETVCLRQASCSGSSSSCPPPVHCPTGRICCGDGLCAANATQCML